MVEWLLRGAPRGGVLVLLWNFLSSFRPALRDEKIALLLSREEVFDPTLGIDDGYTFYIQERSSRRRAGYISLRLGESPQLYYLGHIGYRIDEPFRGHGYAAHACRLLIPFMRQLNLKSVCITADPDNIASRKTCENVGCILESIVPVPPEYQYICSGSTQKCRYILLTDEAD
jgi:predicted acetyltransferase